MNSNFEKTDNFAIYTWILEKSSLGIEVCKF